MPLFIYKGYDKNNKKVIGSNNFNSRNNMNIYLVKSGLVNYEIFESKTKKSFGLFQTISSKELSVFCKKLSVLLYSNINLKESILVLCEESFNKELKTALNEILTHMENGIDFFETITMYNHIFGSYFANMIILGEKSNSLAVVLSKMSDYFEKEEIIRNKIKYSITYPAVVTLFMAGIILLFILRVIPIFKNILYFHVAEVSYLTNTIFYVSTFLGFIVFLLALSIIGVCYYICAHKSSLYLDVIKIKIPILRFMYIQIFTSRVSIGLAMLLKAGMPLSNALERVSILSNNEYLTNKYNDAVERFKEGERLDVALSEAGVFSKFFLKLTIVAIKSKNYEEIFQKSADYFASQTEDCIFKIASIVESILIIIVSIIVLIILLSLIIPMINIISYIG